VDPCADTFYHEWLSVDAAQSWAMQRHSDVLTRVAQQELTLLMHHAVRSLIGLVFVASHLVFYVTMTSLDLQV